MTANQVGKLEAFAGIRFVAGGDLLGDDEVIDGIQQLLVGLIRKDNSLWLSMRPKNDRLSRRPMLA